MLDFVTVQNRVHDRLSSPWRDITGERRWNDVEYLHPIDRPFGANRRMLDEWSEDWKAREAELPPGVNLRWEQDGPDRSRPRALVFDDVSAAARFVGGSCERLFETATATLAALREAGASPTADALRSVVTSVGQGRADLDDLINVTRWVFKQEDLTRWTPWQAGPHAGVESKWIKRNATLLKAVCGFDVVQRMNGRPRTILFSYVDPEYLTRSGARRHDSWTWGDPLTLPYPPRVVVIVENADSRFVFPPLAGGVVVFGGGDAAPGFLAEVPWPSPRPLIVYWGDLDADGMEILGAMRRILGESVRSILMDAAAYRRYASRGASKDQYGRPIDAKERTAAVRGLRASELVADRLVCADGPVRRIEQQAISEHEVAEALVEAGLAPLAE